MRNLKRNKVPDWDLALEPGPLKREKKAMLTKIVKISCGVSFVVALLVQVGCSSNTARSECRAPVKCGKSVCEPPAGEVSAYFPPNAQPGDCFAKVYIPPQYRTLKEKVLVHDAYQKLEVVPARYEWVEERILVKDASTVLEVVPAEFADQEQTIQTAPEETGWEINKNKLCVNPQEEPARDVFCLVKRPPAKTTIVAQRQVKPACVKEVVIPAQYETVRRQRLVSAATTRSVTIPAQYKEVESTVKVCDGRMAWKRIDCKAPGAESVATGAKAGTQFTAKAGANGYYRR
jgi:hypothetical protein